MRRSRYNNYIRLTDSRVLGYNAFIRRFVVLDEDVYAALSEYSTLSRLAEERIAELRKGGFIIEDDLDELDVLDNEIEKNNFSESYYELHVNPTLDCNFRCWYCYEQHQAGSELGGEVLGRLRRHLDRKLTSPVEDFMLSFFGGEPLLKFDSVCKPLIEYAGKLCRQNDIAMRVHFTSNSYLVTPEIAEYLQDKHCSFQITLDGSREFHDKVRFPAPGQGSYDRILSNVKLLADRDIRVVLRINYTLGNIESVEKIITDLLDAGLVNPGNVAVNFQRVWQDFHNKGNEKIKALIAGYGKRLAEGGIFHSIPDLDNPRLGGCYGDRQNYVCVNYDGNFFKCTARDFTPGNRCGHLAEDGSLVWDDGIEQEWKNAKFKREVCRSCRIAPICLGGCRRKNMEMPDNGECPMSYDDARKDELILQRFEAQFM